MTSKPGASQVGVFSLWLGSNKVARGCAGDLWTQVGLHLSSKLASGPRVDGAARCPAGLQGLSRLSEARLQLQRDLAD